MKKFAAFLMILSVSVFSIGCGGKTGEDAAGDGEKTKTGAEEKTGEEEKTGKTPAGDESPSGEQEGEGCCP